MTPRNQPRLQREALQAARFNGVLTVKAGDKWVVASRTPNCSRPCMTWIARLPSRKAARAPPVASASYAGKGL